MPSEKLLIVVPYCPRDAAPASELVRLVSDMESTRNPEADLLLLQRFDADRLPAEVTEEAGTKFEVRFHQSLRKETEWPSACDALWFSAMEWVLANGENRYKALLWMEPDCVPLRRDWIKQANQVWEDAKAFVVGPWATYCHREFVNASALYSCHPAFLRWVVQEVVDKIKPAWDSQLGEKFAAWGSCYCPGMVYSWETKTMSSERFQEILKSGVFFWHGVKDDSLRRLVRQQLNLP